MPRWLERLLAFLLVCGAFAYNQWQLSAHTGQFHRDVQTYVRQSCENGNALRGQLRAEVIALVPVEDQFQALNAFADRSCSSIASKIKL